MKEFGSWFTSHVDPALLRQLPCVDWWNGDDDKPSVTGYLSLYDHHDKMKKYAAVRGSGGTRSIIAIRYEIVDPKTQKVKDTATAALFRRYPNDEDNYAPCSWDQNGKGNTTDSLFKSSPLDEDNLKLLNSLLKGDTVTVRSTHPRSGYHLRLAQPKEKS